MQQTTKSTLLVTVSARINAAPERVYAMIANYRDGHPRILPKEFTGLTVERGGIGDGTVIQFGMRVFGMTRKFRAAVTEPEPGRVLVETNLEGNDAVSTFIVEPVPQQEKADVTISTELTVRSGVLGSVERSLGARFLRPIYIKELALLAACVE